MPKPIIYSVKITLEKIEIKEDCDWLGDGEIYFTTKIGPHDLGRSPVYKRSSGKSIILKSSTYSREFQVKGVSSIPIEMHVYDEDVICDDKLGYIKASVSSPWEKKQYTTPSSLGKCELVWNVANTAIMAQKTKVALVSREHTGSSYKTKLSKPLVALVNIIDVAGLYKPGYNQPTDVSKNTAKLSGYLKGEPGKPGYKSEDDKGRIFINHVPLPGPRTADTKKDWQDTWKKDTQYIDLTVEVTPKDVKLPADANITWEWEDPDDPSNEDPKVRKDAGMILDPNDYVSGVKTATKGDDNIGKCDYPSKDSANPGYEEITPYTKSSGAGSKQCETKIINRISKVRFHCTNVGGDNFIINAKIKDNPKITVSFPDKTGIMTMWKRIDIEYVKMTSAHDIPVNRISEPFQKAFVQFDLGLKRYVPDVIRGGKKVMGLTERRGEIKADKYVTKSKGQFTKEGTPGWFFLAAANEESPLKGLTTKKVYNGKAKISGSNIIKLDAAYTGSTAPDVVYVRNPAKTKTVLFTIDSIPNKKTLKVDPKNYYPSCKHGSIDSMYSTSERVAKNLQDYGFANGMDVEVVVCTPGSYGTGGISPSKKISSTGEDWFAGKTIIYTGWIGSDPDDLLSTTCHELTHGLGFAHICGHRDFRAGSTIFRCAMHYGSFWLLDNAHKPIPWEPGKQSMEMCAPHIVNIRKTHLEDNPGYGW